MKKWNCEVCGYTHLGEEPPERCPRCGAVQSQFEQESRSYWNTFCLVASITLLLVLVFTVFSCKSTVTVDNSAVKSVELNRYLGKWYEIARYDHKFERGMQQCTATYTLLEDGTIRVTNQGMKNGKWSISEGKAKTTDKAGVLRVSFFGPFYSDYRILMLARDYSYALVGGKDDNYLWILSRSPQLKKETRELILREAQRRKYKPDQLIWVMQKDF